MKKRKNKLGSSLELSDDQSNLDNALQNTNVKHVVREFSESVKESVNSRKRPKVYKDFEESQAEERSSPAARQSHGKGILKRPTSLQVSE